MSKLKDAAAVYRAAISDYEQACKATNAARAQLVAAQDHEYRAEQRARATRDDVVTAAAKREDPS